MVKFYSQNYTYDYPFSAVTLAYFLRYPNPYSTHVLSTDTISRSYDPATQRLTTLRLHLKRSKLPSAVLKLVPRSFLGASAGGDTQSYILEKSVVDIKEGWMWTESRNLEWTGVLSVVERQEFKRPDSAFQGDFESKSGTVGALEAWTGFQGAMRRRGETCSKAGSALSLNSDATLGVSSGQQPNIKTDVKTTITLHSSLGSHFKRKTAPSTSTSTSETEEEPKVGFFKSWSTASIQRSIEIIGLKRARRSQPNAKEGMKVVLERMREGGLVAVLEGMRRDREMIMGGHHGFKARRSPNDDDE
jgi:4-amino-4-deoxychorismate lyase